MKRPSLALAAALALSLPLLAGEVKKFEKSVPFHADETKLGIKVDDKVSIDSVRIRHWPDSDDFSKAERELNDKHTMVVEFTYTNRDLDRNYKCRYDVKIPGGDGVMLGENDRTATLDKGKVGDTNKMLIKMRTNDYKVAKTMKISFEVSPK